MKNFKIYIRLTEAMAEAIRARGGSVAGTVRIALEAWSKHNGARLESVPCVAPRACAPAQAGKVGVVVPPEWRRPFERAVLARRTTMSALATAAVAEYLGVPLPEDEQHEPGWRVSFAMPEALAAALAQSGGVGAVVRPALRAWSQAEGVDLPEMPDQRVPGPSASKLQVARTATVMLPAAWRGPLDAWSAAKNVLVSVVVREAVARYVNAEMPGRGWSTSFKTARQERDAKAGRGCHGAPCPVCGGGAVDRERRMNEWDAVCAQGHRWWQDIPGVKSHVHVYPGDDETEDAA